MTAVHYNLTKALRDENKQIRREAHVKIYNNMIMPGQPGIFSHSLHNLENLNPVHAIKKHSGLSFQC